MVDFDRLCDEMYAWLLRIVQINSDTENIKGIREVIDTCAPHFREMEFEVEVVGGRHMRARREGAVKPGVLFLGHLDTYRPMDGSHMELLKEGDVLKGHGVSDMKAGIAVVVFGLKYLHAQGALQDRKITVLFNSDEETGSVSSRQIIEDEAQNHGLVLVFEGGKRAEEGKTTFVIERNGLCAATFVFSHIERGGASSDSRGDAHKGEREFHVEFPFKNPDEVQGIHRELEHIVEKTREMHRELGKAVPSRIEIKICRPPMIPSPQTLEYAEVLERSGREMGHPVVPRTRPGMSDGCFTAALGIPTLDGLGPVGTNWHTKDEYLEIPTLRKRTELFIRFWKHLFGSLEAESGEMVETSDRR